MRMQFTESGPWAPGEQGARQRLAYVVRGWLNEEEFSVATAADFLANDKRWPQGVVPFSSGTIQNVAGLESAEKPEAKGSNMSSAWAVCEYWHVSAEWIFTGKLAMSRNAEIPTADFETELARRVLEKMPDDTPQKPGDLPRQVAVIGAKCFDAAVTAAREEWTQTDEFTVLMATLNRAVTAARKEYARTGTERARRDYRQTEADVTRVWAAYSTGQGYRIFRPYPLEEDYTVPVYSRDLRAYGFESAAPAAQATRVPPSVQLLLSDGPESKRAAKAVQAKQAAEESARRAARAKTATR